MKNVDTSKVWQGKRKPEKLEMKGFSTPQSIEPAKKDKVVNREKRSKQVKATKKPPNRDTTQPRYRDTTTPRYHNTIEIIRKAVKDYGKEAATHRFTLDEKKAIAEIIFKFNDKNIKTSENQIARIAVNFIIQDYKESGNESILVKALDALNK